MTYHTRHFGKLATLVAKTIKNRMVHGKKAASTYLSYRLPVSKTFVGQGVTNNQGINVNRIHANPLNINVKNDMKHFPIVTNNVKNENSFNFEVMRFSLLKAPVT
jgi:hypothetical protein